MSPRDRAIIEDAAALFHIPPAVVMGRTQSGAVVSARRLAWIVLWMTGSTCGQIAALFGRSESAVGKVVRNAEVWRSDHPEHAGAIERLSEKNLLRNQQEPTGSGT